jgi:hypothetical protein
MTSGGARNRSGPPVDPASGRSDQRGFSLTALPAEGFRGVVPEFPLPDVTDRELEVWAAAWRTPQACAWSMPSEAWRARTVALWVRTTVRCEASDAPSSLLGQLHRFADQIGMTTAGLAEMGWQIATDELAARRTQADVPKEGPQRDLGEKWILQHCRVPDGFRRGKPFELADWQFWCHANRYRVREGVVFVPPERVGPDEPPVLNQAFFYRMTLIVAPQKTGKGPFTASQVAFEACGPSVFAGWARGGEVYYCADNGCDCGWAYSYLEGDPMGMRHPSPLIQITANSEEQAGNIYRPLKAMIQLGPLKKLLAVRDGFVRILGLSDQDDFDRIDVVTSSARSRLGNPISDAEQDEVGLYTESNKMIDVADNQARGAAGMGGRTHLTTNAWDPAENSYAQQVYEAKEEDVFVFYRNPDDVLRNADGKPLDYKVKADRRKIHEFAYEGSWWVNLDSIEATAVSLLARDPAQAERFFGNRLVAGAGKWILPEEWDSKKIKSPFIVAPRTAVAMGMDLSNNNDWTGIRLETADLYQFTPTYDVGGDKRPTVWDPALFGGFIPRGEVRSAVDYLATQYRIVRAYIDPAGSAMGAVDDSALEDDDSWRTELATWAEKYGPKVFIPWSCSRLTPMHASLEQFRSAIRNPESHFTHDGDKVTRTHITNAVMIAKTMRRYVLGKPYGADHQKIDQAMSSDLAHEATMDAIANGDFADPETDYVWF